MQCAQGVVTLLADFVVCKAGDVLTPQQAALLRVFEVKMAVFRMKLIGRWTAQGRSAVCAALVLHTHKPCIHRRTV